MIVLTGFEPFGNFRINPSWEAIKKLNEGKKIRIPVTFRDAIRWGERIAEMKPEVVIATGLNPSARGIVVEAIGINIMHSKIADNSGFKPSNLKIYEDGENCYFTNLPYMEIADHLNGMGIPARVSFHAGTYVCNTLYYSLLHNSKGKNPEGKVIFIHVPPSKETLEGNCENCWDIEETREGIKEIIKFISRLSSP